MTTVVGSKALIRGGKPENLIGVCQTTTKKTEGKQQKYVFCHFGRVTYIARR